MEVVAFIVLCLGASYLLSMLFKRAKLPGVLAPIAIGLMLGNTSMGGILGDLAVMEGFAQLGIVFLIFYVGLQFDPNNVRSNFRPLLTSSLIILLIPAVVGFLIGWLFELTWFACLILAAIFTIIADAVPIGILEERGLLKSWLGQRVVFIATVSDALVAVQIVLVVALLDASSSFADVFFRILLELLIFATVVYVAVFVVAPELLRAVRKHHSERDFFIISMILALAMATAAEFLDLGKIIGALIAGMVVRHAMQTGHEEQSESDLEEFIETLTMGVFVPFFFIWIGLNTKLDLLFDNPMLGVILVVGFYGSKLATSFVVSHVQKQPWRESAIFALGATFLGSEDLVFAELARSTGILGESVFAAIVFLIIMSLVVSPIAYQWGVSRIFSKPAAAAVAAPAAAAEHAEHKDLNSPAPVDVPR